MSKKVTKKAVKTSKSTKSISKSVKTDETYLTKTTKKNVAKNTPETELDKVISQIPDDQKERLQQIRVSLEKFKEKIIPRLEGYVMGISLLPPSKPDEKSDKKNDKDKKNLADKINVLLLIDDKDSKRMAKEELQEKVQKIADDLAKPIDQDLVVQAVLLSEVWQQCYDAKYDLLQMIAMGATVYDTGMLAAIKISEVHKTMVLKKFEKYIVSYVLAGSLTQGRATPESDVDVFIVIDDTDVKKMTRVELRDKLRAIIIGMGAEAGQMTGIQNKINIQVYILTDFWDNIKDASPVIFTFLRDGVPFYDRGTFMPWKQLLQMGRVKPSPEAIDMYMSSGSQMMGRIEAKIKDIVMEDLFWALLTPSQAALMMYGIPPTTPKETPEVMESILVKKEKILEAKYVKTLSKVLKIRKDLEHGTKKTVSGKEMDGLVKESTEFLTRLEKLFKEIEERKQEEQVLGMYENIVTIVRDVLRFEGITTVDEKDLEKLFVEHIIKKGYVAEQYKRLFENLLQAKKDYDAKKLTKQEVHNAIKDARELTKILVEHIQRKRGQELEKTKIRVKYDENKFGEIILLGETAYIIKNVDEPEKSLSKANITKNGNLENHSNASLEEFENALMKIEIPPKVFIKSHIFNDIKLLFGEDVEILFNY